MNAMTCQGCGGAWVPGAILCGACGTPVMQPAVPSPPPAGLAQRGPAAHVNELAVVEGGPGGARIMVPAEGVDVILGRHDLTRNPPWVVDVDLGRLMALGPADSPPVSRDQALLTRRAGEVIITPRGQAPVLRRPKGSVDYQPLPPQAAQPVQAGDRLAFGHGSRVLVLEAR